MFVIDAALANKLVLFPLQKWTRAISIRALRPNEVIKDDRIPVLLRELNKPAFITIDEAGFWKKNLCDRHYSILYFALNKDQQQLIPMLLRQLLRLPKFKTKSVRMGKVACVSTTNVKYYQFKDEKLYLLNWHKGLNAFP
jgi:hypothetical protein